MSSLAEGATLVAADHRTHYHEAGTGQPVVLLHGSGPGVSAWANWWGNLPELAATFRVVAFDIAGFGTTELKEGTAYSIKLWVAHLFGVLDALGMASATLVGNSFGGGLALAATLSDPTRVDGLVLLGTPAGEFPMSEALREGWYYEPSPEAMRAMLLRFPYDPALVTDEMVASRFEASARPGAQAAYRKLLPQPAPAGDDTTVRGVPEKALATIEVPALVVHGRDDKVIPLDVGLTLHRCLPDSELHAFGQCGHWVQIERREAFNGLVRDFVHRRARRS